jgi:hypothetical protein
MNVSLQDQVRCAQRELAMRLRVYPKWVREGKITKEKQDLEIAGMSAIVTSLQKLHDLWQVSEQIRGPLVPEIKTEAPKELKQAALI